MNIRVGVVVAVLATAACAGVRGPDAIIVNAKSPVAGLTVRQVEQIFTGDVTDWSAVGGRPGKISVYTRNTSSGTYSDWKDLAMKKRDYAKSSQKMAGNEQIAANFGLFFGLAIQAYEATLVPDQTPLDPILAFMTPLLQAGQTSTQALAAAPARGRKNRGTGHTIGRSRFRA